MLLIHMDEHSIGENRDLSGPPFLPMHHGQPLAPVSSVERIISMDVLRGLALLGILISNMQVFSQPLEDFGYRGGLWLGWADRWADWITVFLVEGKFYPLFSFLFGLGFSIQMDRAVARGLDFRATYRRRLFILMGFGLAHGILLWEGDVLLAYAVCGFFLLLFRDRKPRTIVVWAAVLLLLLGLLTLAVAGLVIAFSNSPEFAESVAKSFGDGPLAKAEKMKAFVTGGYADAVVYRLGELVEMISGALYSVPTILGLFLFGLWAGRKKIITEVAGNRALLVCIFVIGGVLGLMGNFCGAWVLMSSSQRGDGGTWLTAIGIISIFGPVLTAAYVAGIVLLLDRRPTLPFLPPIAAVGRMALTHYLTQSLIATTLFYGYGFGLAGHVGKLGIIGIALLIFAAQIGSSVWWLKYFRYGPLEWLWRSLTYGARQPMRCEI